MLTGTILLTDQSLRINFCRDPKIEQEGFVNRSCPARRERDTRVSLRVLATPW